MKAKANAEKLMGNVEMLLDRSDTVETKLNQIFEALQRSGVLPSND